MQTSLTGSAGVTGVGSGYHSADRALQLSVTGWVLVALAGQWLFAFYIAVLYAVPALTGNYEGANQARPITGYVAGDTVGNLMLFAHVLPAAMLSVGGVLQLLPALRRRWPQLHRWNGRVFLVMGLLGALTGLYLTWVRGSRLSDLGAIGITINGLLIPVAVLLAWRAARARQFDRHRRWAVHAFLLINGVWTFRLYLMGWYLVNHGQNGNTNNLDGPVDLFISVACYALPMAVAELWFWAQRQHHVARKWWVAAMLSLAALITLLGVVAAILMMWLPRIGNVLAG
ncbi:DUF2306 domain-containing protein [Permianibacter sp. IMCC34836]|uniref:DUF2306 domain-containing protein n=1 Tax=Permianibacter fluminis TaxID=2738515 RepID=UPI0015556C2B|nr:DUF2306 domain-containing protein [Permianibacter fluminis]NQD36746.1 DUF2306 domain-containing protein [Permianibacter fluminis]